MTDTVKNFGIKGALPPGDPMRNAHLLGDDFVFERWYASEAERDQVYTDMIAQHPHYRKGDFPSLILEKVQR